MINPNDLRVLADFLDEHPTLAENLRVQASSFTWNKESWQEMLDELGTFEKKVTDWSLAAERTFGEGLEVRVSCDREATCTKRQVGFKRVTKEVYPEDVKPATVVEEEPLYEWDCPSEWKTRPGISA